jgi:hypothetical protein
LKTLAKIISTVGNPLTLALFFGFYLFYLEKDNPTQRNLPLFFMLSVVIPIGVYVGYNVRKKDLLITTFLTEINAKAFIRFL